MLHGTAHLEITRPDADRFVAAFDVAVHEHCEERVGQPTCDHYAGDPVPDGLTFAENAASLALARKAAFIEECRVRDAVFFDAHITTAFASAL